MKLQFRMEFVLSSYTPYYRVNKKLHCFAIRYKTDFQLRNGLVFSQVLVASYMQYQSSPDQTF